MTPMAPAREKLWIPLALVAVGVAVFVLLLVRARAAADRRVAEEDLALQALLRVASAQAAYHMRGGRYGWLEDLRTAGLLGDLTLHEGDPGLAVASPGYRIEVLLPHTLDSANHMQVAPRSGQRSNEALERAHFVVAARPWSDETGGWRSYATDETGRVYVNEGVSDPRARGRPALPDLHLSRGSPPEAGGMRWWPLNDLPDR